jgi:hypothetical protein
VLNYQSELTIPANSLPLKGQYKAPNLATAECQLSGTTETACTSEIKRTADIRRRVESAGKKIIRRFCVYSPYVNYDKQPSFGSKMPDWQGCSDLKYFEVF